MDFVGIVGIVGTLTAAIITQLFMSLREKRRIELELKRFEIEHPDVLESEIKCRFYGPVSESYMATFSIDIHNRGHKRFNISSVRLRIRGIRKDDELRLYDKRISGGRVEFPVKLIDEELVPRKYAYVFIEGGHKQEFTLATIVPAEFRYILVNARLGDKSSSVHGSLLERIFEVAGNNH